MALLEKIEEIIKRKEFLIQPESGKPYRLEEPAIANYPKTIIKQKGKLLVYKFDINNNQNLVFPIFNPQVPDLVKVSDYILFYQKKKTLFVFICDLKSGKKQAKVQLESGFVLGEYIVRMAQKQLAFRKFDVSYRALVFSKNHTTKISTNLKKDAGYIKLQGSQLKYLALKAGHNCYIDNLCF